MSDFVEAEGLVHLMNPAQGEFTLCGDAFDLASDIEGYEQKKIKKRVVTCEVCSRIIEGCRGIRCEP